MEGYPESVKFLHNNKGWNHAAPILSNTIYVKEAYRAAVENVLEPYLNFYVVNNLQEGLTAINLLQEHKKGKANFFLLDKINELELNKNIDLSTPNLISALSVVEVSEEYENLAKYLLNNVYITTADDVDVTGLNDCTILEKTGKFVKRNVSLTGGNVGLFEGKKIGRAKNLEKLQEQIVIQEVVVNELKAIINSKHNQVLEFNQQLKDGAIKQVQLEVNNQTNNIYGLQNKLEGLHQTETTANQRLQGLKDGLQKSNIDVVEIKEALQKLNTIVQEANNALNVIETDYKQAEQNYNKVSVEYNEANIQLTRQQSKLVTINQELSFKTNQLNDLKNQIAANTKQLQDTTTGTTSTNEKLQTAEKELIDLLRQKETEEKALNEADQTYYNLRNLLQTKDAAVRLKQKAKELIDNTLNEIKERLTNLKLQLAGMKERLHVEFRVDIDDVLKEERTGALSIDDLQATSDKLKKRLENIGEVNPTAIEAYTEMKKRYDFIVEQKTDLVDAKDSLLQTIQEVETTANQKFLTTFNAVRENFSKVFKALFTEEDQCDMVLADPNNLAETAIDIIAKPKGKRPSSIGQLSGGEKTLTATALLFAIYLIKPAPFCILDEVDAPLDDANVGKFTQMIRKFSENSQFIIVTHNKMTMSTVDVIYGVTMQEPGVSKLVPVDFRSLN
jgi:chromosome segregation protein